MGAMKELHIDTEAARLREENERLREENEKLEAHVNQLLQALCLRALNERANDV